MRKLKKGFTIVELVIVIAVVAVLTAVLVPTFIHLTKKAKDASDKTVVKNANIQLASQEGVEGKNKSMHDAVLDVKEIGYHIPTVQTGNENKILWDKNNDRFVLVDKDDKVLHSDAGVAVGDKIEGDAKLNYFYAVDALGKRDGYSVYALGKSVLDTTGESPVVNIAGFGFDAGDIGESAGETEDDKKFTINVADSNKEILVATSSVSTNLSVNAPNGVVTHAGIAGEEDIVAIKSSSFHEQGRVGFIKMGTGNFVAESSAEIKALWFSNPEATYDKKSGAIVTEYADSEAIKAAVGLDSGTAVREEIIVGEDIDDVKDVAVKELDHEINPVTVVAEEIGTWAQLIAFTERDDERTGVITADIDFEMFPLEIKGNKTIDLNGHTLALANGTYDSKDDLSEGCLIYVGSDAELTLNDSSGNNSGVIKYKSVPDSAGDNDKGTFLICNRGRLTINGGSYTGAMSYFAALGPWYTISHGVLLNYAHAIINGGNFLIKSSMIHLVNEIFINGLNKYWVTEEYTKTFATLEILGGTFTNENDANGIVRNAVHKLFHKAAGVVLGPNGEPYDPTKIHTSITDEYATDGVYTMDPQSGIRCFTEEQEYTAENNYTITIIDNTFNDDKIEWTIVKSDSTYTVSHQPYVEE